MMLLARVNIGGRAYVIIGVMPAAFSFRRG
jgi:hypothetical protein